MIIATMVTVVIMIKNNTTDKTPAAIGTAGFSCATVKEDIVN